MHYINIRIVLLISVALIVGCAAPSTPTPIPQNETATRAAMAAEIELRLTATASAIQAVVPTASPSPQATATSTALPTATATRVPSPTPAPTILVKPVDRIAFVSDRNHRNSGCLSDPRTCPKEIYLMKPDGSEQQRLTKEAGFPEEPLRLVWNPERTGLLLNLNGPHSYWVDLDGHVKKKDQGDVAPDFSPNGKFISFGTSTPGGYPNGIGLFVMNADESNRHMIMYPSGEGNDWGYGFSSWSPDSKEIAFSRAYAGKGIWGIKPDGTGLRQLSPPIQSRFLAWSPDGTKIAFEGGDFYSQFDIWVLDLPSKKMVDLTNTEDFDEFVPTWSPDSKQIAFQRMTGKSDIREAQIFVMDADGSNVKQLTTEGYNYAPAWAR